MTQAVAQEMPMDSGDAIPEDGPSLFDVWEDLEDVASWCKLKGLGGFRPFRMGLGRPQPRWVREAASRLGALTFEDLFPAGIAGLEDDLFLDAGPTVDDEEPEDEEPMVPDTFSEAIQCASAAFDAQEDAVFRMRFLTDGRPSLRAVGARLGVTGSRISQIESAVKARLKPVFDEYGVERKLAGLFTPDRPFMKLAQAQEILPELDERLGLFDVPTAYLIRNYCDFLFEIKDDWIVVSSMKSAKRLFESTMKRLIAKHNVIAAGRLSSLDFLDAQGQRTGTVDDWIRYHQYFTYLGCVILAKDTKEIASAILFIEGRPMPTEELAMAISPGETVASFQGSLYPTSQLIRVGRREWALREWGMQEYQSIRQILFDTIDIHGGSYPYGQLIDEVSERYAVTRNSVISFVSDFPFYVDDGIVYIDEDGEEGIPSDNPFETKHLFRGHDSWMWRCTINDRVMRGNGIEAPRSIANILGMTFGAKKRLPSRLGAQYVYWKSRDVCIGSVKRFLDSRPRAQGEQFFIVFHDDGDFDVRMARPLFGNALRDAGTLAGCPPSLTSGEVLRYLAAAVGLQKDTDVRTISSQYRGRGDTDIAELLDAVAG